MRTRSLGLSLGAGALAFVELEKVLGRSRVRRAGSLPFTLPAEAAGAPAAGRDEGRAAAGKLAAGTAPAAVVVGLPRQAVVLRVVEVPLADEKDLAGLIAYEVDRHMPFPPEDAYYGFQRIGQEGAQARVLLAAAHKRQVDPVLAALEALGVTPTVLTLAALGGVNALSAHDRRAREVVCLVEQEGGQAEVTLLRDGELLSSRAVSLEGESVAPILEEIARAGAAAAPPAVVRIGRGGESLRARLREALDVPVAPWSREGAPAASAYGLALQGLGRGAVRLNLLPARIGAPRREPALRVMYGLLATAVLLAGALGVGWAYRERATLEKLRGDARAVRAQAAAVEKLKAEAKELSGRLQVLDGVTRERARGLLVLKEVASLLPRDVALTEFLLEGARVQIRGTTGGSAAELIAAFERSTVLENAAFTSPIAQQGKDRQGFQLQAFVRTR
ncbi:MAG: pilus assembly protein PilM [Candidatus Methylomirabilales bacterium]